MTILQRVWLVCAVLVFVTLWAVPRAQSPDHERRLDRLEAIRPEPRLAVLESQYQEVRDQLNDIKNLGYGVLVVVIGQLALAVIAVPRRRRSSSTDD